jgi:hypothetical protein
LALAGIILFTLSLPQTWADFPDSSPAPGPLHVFDVLYPQFGLLTYAIFCVVPFAGFCLWTLMWHPQFSREAMRLFPLWALVVTALCGYIVYLIIIMPVSFPDVGFWLVAAALFLIWNAVLVQSRALSHVSEAVMVPIIIPARQRFIVAGTLVFGMCIWLAGYFTLFWATGATCGWSPLQTPHCWPRVNAITALAFEINITNYSPIAFAVFLFLLIAVMLCGAVIYCWSNGFRGRQLHALALAMLALAVLTVLSAAGTASSMSSADPAPLNLGAGFPIAVIGLALAWLGLIGLYWMRDAQSGNMSRVRGPAGG